MSDRITVAQARSLIARVAMNGIPSSDPRVISYINEATQRLMNEGKIYVGMVAEVMICTQQQCFSLPRDLESVLELFIPDDTLDVVNGWYTIENPSTYVDPDYLNDLVLIDRGEHPTVFDICGAVNLKLYSVLPEAASLQVRVFGTDVNGQEIFQNIDGAYSPGELIPLSVAGTVSKNQFASITNIQLPQRNSPSSLFMMVPAAGAVPASEVLLAVFEPDETVPAYRRYYCQDIPLPTDPAKPTMIRITGKRRFKPVTQDSDFLIISNIPALKMEVMAIDREEASEQTADNAKYYHSRAVELLENEAKNFQIDPTRVSGRKAQYLLDEQTYDHRQLGYIRARLCLECPNLLKVGQRLVTRAINNAQLRLISMANWKDSVQTLRMKVFENGWLILPPQVESLLTIHRGRMPLTIRGPWFEATDNGPGRATSHDFYAFNAIDRGVAPTFVDMRNPSEITVQTNLLEATGEGIELFGINQENEEVSETVLWNEMSQNIYLSVTRIIKPITKSYIQLSSADHPVLAILPAAEQVPMFRRYWIPGLGENFDPGLLFSVQVKLRHSDVAHAEDILTVSNYTALKAMVLAIAMEDSGKAPDAQAYEGTAVKILQNELKAHRGLHINTLNIQTRGFGGSRIRQGR